MVMIRQYFIRRHDGKFWGHDSEGAGRWEGAPRRAWAASGLASQVRAIAERADFGPFEVLEIALDVEPHAPASDVRLAEAVAADRIRGDLPPMVTCGGEGFSGLVRAEGLRVHPPECHGGDDEGRRRSAGTIRTAWGEVPHGARERCGEGR